jgi:hypothetical protein
VAAHPATATSAAELLYRLCSGADTSKLVLDSLRRYQFFYKRLLGLRKQTQVTFT